MNQLNQEGQTINLPNSNYYQHYENQLDHIIARPGMYIGSVDKVQYVDRILVFPEGKPQIIQATIDTPQGLERLYLEILSNAADNVTRSRELKIDIDVIEIAMDRKIVTIRNGGCPIPIEYSNYDGKNGKRLWVPELIFGTLLSSSTYDPNVVRTGSSVNGLGSKLTAAMSHTFTCHIGNANQKLQYAQTWTDHMKNRSEPQITQYTGPNFVQISYEMDFSYFKYPTPDQEGGGYTDEMIYLFARHAADVSFTAKCPVIFNGMNFSFQNVMDYAELYFGNKIETCIVHYEWPSNTETVTRKGQVVAKDPNVMPIVEMCCLDTTDDSTCISFVNGMITREGGVHVNAAYKTMSGTVLDKINASIERMKKKGKSKDKKEETRKRPALTIADVKPHISMLLACRLPNPQYIGQTKNSLSGPTPKIQIPERLLRCVEKWDLMNRLMATVEARDFKNLTKTDGKKKRFVGIAKLEDCNEVAGPKASDCTLIGVEGDSAMGYGKYLIACLPNGSDFFGLWPAKGKPQNVMNFTNIQIMENAEFNELKQALGLEENTDYTIEANYKKLRYGHFLLCTDGDFDGAHIQGLFLNYFHCRYPTLLQRGYLMYMKTPVLRLFKGKEKLNFFSELLYEQWKTKTGNEYKSWKHKYCKGLGSSKPSDIVEDARTPKIVCCVYDDSSPAAFQLAFDKKFTDLRKKWIQEYKPLLQFDEFQMEPISQFLYYKLVEYSVANVSRSIPKLIDGLKESQRKIMWGTLTKWGSQKGVKKWKKGILTGDVDEFKVAQLGAHVAKYAYKHGETILFDTIVGMAHDFVGTNNLPYFIPDGMLGTRNMLGKDAANSRYTFVRPQWWLPLIYRNEDMPLLERMLVIDEGEENEPKTFLPILPMCLVNGCEGIGTGYSTYIPPHDPIVLCEWIKAKIHNGTLPEILPWFREFTGGIQVVLRKPKGQDEDQEVEIKTRKADSILDADEIDLDKVQELADESDGKLTSIDNVNSETLDEMSPQTSPEPQPNTIEVIEATKGKSSLITTGVYREENGKIIISELPIRRATLTYNSWLEELAQAGEIKTKKSYSQPNTVHFEITGFKNPSIKNLKLQKSFGLSNMVLLDINSRPFKFENAQTIMEEYYVQRLPYYSARKDNIVQTLQAQIDKLTDRMRFIQCVLEGKIIVYEPGSGRRTRKKVEILAQMRDNQIPEYVFAEVHLSHLQEEDVEGLKEKIDKLVEQRTLIENTTPEQMWINDIDEFIEEYDHYYKNVYQSPKNLNAQPTAASAAAPGTETRKRAPRKATSTRGRGGKAGRGGAKTRGRGAKGKAK